MNKELQSYMKMLAADHGFMAPEVICSVWMRKVMCVVMPFLAHRL